MQYIKFLTELIQANLPIAGGKGANLGALIQAGLPVPPGFCITTPAYRAFVEMNKLGTEIRQILDATRMDEPTSLDTACNSIHACFQHGEMPLALTDEIRQAYANLHNPPGPVAVRSSATAEDLPDLSFAGQHDTYLNILGEAALLEAIIRCWASLWTARAIGYRARNQISHDDVALAVVVQQMVQSEASGVLFTANPLTGKRSETVIDATLGLGEALVSGQVEPDHYVVAGSGEKILEKTLGAKALSIQGQAEGGTVTLHHSAANLQALPDEQILELARLGQQAQIYFGSPQDMEWAWAEGRLYVVQSRPVTSLYPLPLGLAEQPLEALLFFGVWQGMIDPYTPLGRDMFSTLVAGMGSIFGAKINAREQRIFLSAGERLFVNLTGLLKNKIGRNVATIFIGAIDPVSGDILAGLLKDPRFDVIGSFRLRDKFRLIRGIAPLIGNVLYNLLWPARGRARLEKQIEAVLDKAQNRFNAAENLMELIETIESLREIPQKMLPRLVAGIAAGQAPLQILLRQKKLPVSPELLMELTRGLPHNVTTEMDLALWRASQTIRTNVAVAAHFTTTEIDVLVAEFRHGQLTEPAQTAIAQFLGTYGMRGIGEIDLGRIRWREDPTPIFQVLKSYLQIDPAASPEAIFKRGADKARETQEQLVAALKKAGNGFKAQVVNEMARRIRELGGLRETPKFFVVRLFGLYRETLRIAGQKLVEAGRLTESEDVFFLYLRELKTLDNSETRDWKALIKERQATYARELRRRRIPRIMLSDGTAFYDAPSIGEAANTLSGNPVSAGVVEGVVRVVLNPHGVQLIPGEILVCPATDPAWTPLFLAAGGLVMEVGGMMTHGSVVAREYGIPAVVSVSQATIRLKDGQRVRVDGSSGIVTVLEGK
ncbi:MAG: PEP-utilizing enzyme [Chloroflexi bacterium]|nr:PEP-utilizing enzyme [Chloroflexota bacterium]